MNEDSLFVTGRLLSNIMIDSVAKERRVGKQRVVKQTVQVENKNGTRRNNYDNAYLVFEANFPVSLHG